MSDRLPVRRLQVPGAEAPDPAGDVRGDGGQVDRIDLPALLDEVVDYLGDVYGRRENQAVRQQLVRCTLSDQLTALLDDSTGRIHPQSVPLRQLLVSLNRPKSRPIWLRTPQISALLRDLATGTVPLTHDAIQALPNWRTAAYLRDLLMSSGVLPHLDRRLLLFERWLAQWISTTADTEHARTLQHFATWHQLRKLRAKAARSPLGTSTTQESRQQITQTGAFLV